jgi:glycosyltransferase involved in cell wall biosynthesis
LACGIPVVQPPVGAFPEIINKSEGGIIYKENNAESLSQSLNSLINNKEQLKLISEKARKSAEEIFNVNLLAVQLVSKYEQTKAKYVTTAQ